MIEKIFSLELKFHDDEFEYQVVKFIDHKSNVTSVVEVQYFELMDNGRLEDIILQRDFIDFLEIYCGVKNYSSVDAIDIEYSDEDIIYIHYMKNTCIDKENPISENQQENVTI